MSGRRAKRRRAGKATSGRERLATRSNGTREKKKRPVVFSLLAAGTLLLAGFLLKPAVFGRDGPTPDAAIIDIAAHMGGFDRSVIRVRVGEPATIRLTSMDNRFHTDGGGRHQFAVDELGVDIVAPPLGSAMGTFTPEKPGTYVFYCDICCGGRANPAMSGTLIVTEA